MSKRISLKLTDKNDWLIEAIENARISQNRPSTNNMVETILVSYFNNQSKNSTNEKVQCPNKCLNGKVKYYSDPNIALFDLVNCKYCNGDGEVSKEKEKEILNIL